MAVTADILASYRHPAAAVTRILATAPREDRALMTVMAASAMVFASQWPVAARAAHFDPSVPLEARLSGNLLAAVFLLPLLAYGLAALSRLAAGFCGGKGSHYGARIALFWAMLAVAPLMLLQGLAAGLWGAQAGVSLLGLGIFAAFLWIWGGGLWAAEFGQQDG